MGMRLGYLGEVVPLYEVPGNVTGRCTIDTRSNVMPGHPRICTSAQLVYREREVKGRISHLDDKRVLQPSLVPRAWERGSLQPYR